MKPSTTPGAADPKALRAHYRALRRSLEPAVRAAADAAAQTHVLAWPPVRAAARLALYRAFDGEPSTELIEAAARAAGQDVLFARHRPAAPLELVRAESWRLGPWGLPVPEGPVVELEATDVIVVPGVAFDQEGYRLGLGGGYYDRTLAVSPALPVGLCYSGQVLERLPRAPWDRPVVALATEHHLHSFIHRERS